MNDIFPPTSTSSAAKRWRFRSPLAEFSEGVPAIQRPLWDKHDTHREAGLGTVALLQDHICFLYVVVCKFNPELGTAGKLN